MRNDTHDRSDHIAVGSFTHLVLFLRLLPRHVLHILAVDGKPGYGVMLRGAFVLRRSLLTMQRKITRGDVGGGDSVQFVQEFCECWSACSISKRRCISPVTLNPTHTLRALSQFHSAATTTLYFAACTSAHTSSQAAALSQASCSTASRTNPSAPRSSRTTRSLQPVHAE